MIGVVLHPLGQLAEAGAVFGRMHVALIQHVADQQIVVQPGDQPVGGLPLTGFLDVEDLAVKLAVLGRQDAQADRLGPDGLDRHRLVQQREFGRHADGGRLNLGGGKCRAGEYGHSGEQSGHDDPGVRPPVTNNANHLHAPTAP